MPVVQLVCTKDSIIRHDHYGSGVDVHAVVTTDEAGHAVSFLAQFEALPSGIVTLNYARHYRRRTSADGFHDSADTGAQTHAERITSSWAEGTWGSDHTYASTNAVVWPGPSTTTSGASDSGTQTQPASDGTFWYHDVTDIVQAWVDGQPDYGIKFSGVGSGDVVFDSRHVTDSSQRHYLEISYETNVAPNAPTGLTPTGNTTVNSLTPTLAGTFSDPDAGDTLSGVQYQVYADDGTTLIWDSGSVTASGTSFSKVYSGSALTGLTYYKWRARTKDAAGVWGPYSTLQRFRVNSTPNTPTLALVESPTTALRTLTPTFLISHSDPDPGDTKAYKYRIVLQTAAGASVWDSGDVTLGTPVTTASVAYTGPALNWQTAYRWKARTQDSAGAWSSYSNYSNFTTATTTAPTSLVPTGGATANALAPAFSGSRGDSADSLASVNIQVYNSAGTTLIWDSGTVSSGVTATGFSVTYTGTTLAFATAYKWRARVTGATGGTSAFSALQDFVTPAAADVQTTTPDGHGIEDLTPDLSFSRGNSFNAYQVQVVRVSDSTTMWDSGTVSMTSGTSKTVTYAGTALAWNTEYKWRVRVSSDAGSTWGNGYSAYKNFTTDSNDVPTLTAPAADAWTADQTPTLSGSTASGNATAFRILIYADDLVTLIWDSTDVSQTAAATFSKDYNGATTLNKGSDYYWQARYTKSTGPNSQYSALRKFHINADPSVPSGLTPTTGTVAGSLTPDLKATFEDDDLTTYGDTPSLLEFEVRLNSDGSLVQGLSNGTGLVAGENTITYSGAALSYDTEYKLRARYTDSKGAVGPWSSYSVFRISQSPTTTIVAPAGPTVSSPGFLIDWTMTSPGGKSQQQYQVKITRTSDDVVVYDSGVVTSSTTEHTLPVGYLQNTEGYDIEVTAWDTDLLPGTDTLSVTASWTAPDAVEGFSASLDEDTSVVTLAWDQSSLVDFTKFGIYRKETTDDDWTLYDTLTDQTLVSYVDYFASEGVTYRYKITQFKSVTGDDDLESNSSVEAEVFIQTDDWVVIGVDRSDDHIFSLPVDDEDHSNPIQSEKFEPVGSNRKSIARGNALGAEGQLSIVWEPDDVKDGKKRLKYLRETAGPHILKSPFGDIWLVDFDGSDGKYAQGGSLNDKIAWTEVA